MTTTYRSILVGREHWPDFVLETVFESSTPMFPEAVNVRRRDTCRQLQELVGEGDGANGRVPAENEKIILFLFRDVSKYNISFTYLRGRVCVCSNLLVHTYITKIIILIKSRRR